MDAIQMPKIPCRRVWRGRRREDILPVFIKQTAGAARCRRFFRFVQVPGRGLLIISGEIGFAAQGFPGGMEELIRPGVNSQSLSVLHQLGLWGKKEA